MTAQQHYDGLDSEQRQELLLKVGETREEAQMLSQRDYVALGGWAKAGSRGNGGRRKPSR
jgi:hypothetical protein